MAKILAVLEARTKLLAFFFGLCFVTALLVLAICFPDPTAFQYTVFRIVLALAAAGVAGVIPGMIRLKVQPGTALLIHAGGALAVFVMVYLLAPAALKTEQVQEVPPSPSSKEKSAALQPLKISGVDRIENGIYVLNFTPPETVYLIKLINSNNIDRHVSLINFPTKYFYTNIIHDTATIKANSDKYISIVLKYNFSEKFPSDKIYKFEIEDNDENSAKLVIQINDEWDEHISQQRQRIAEKIDEIPYESIPSIFELNIKSYTYLLLIGKERIQQDISKEISINIAELNAKSNLIDFLTKEDEGYGKVDIFKTGDIQKIKNEITKRNIMFLRKIDVVNGYAIAVAGIYKKNRK